MDQARTAAVERVKSPIAINNNINTSAYFFDPNQTQITNNEISNESQKIIQKNSDAPLNSVPRDIDDGEFCMIHRRERLIAMDDSTPAKFGCNKCVFERLL